MIFAVIGKNKTHSLCVNCSLSIYRHLHFLPIICAIFRKQWVPVLHNPIKKSICTFNNAISILSLIDLKCLTQRSDYISGIPLPPIYQTNICYTIAFFIKKNKYFVIVFELAYFPSFCYCFLCYNSVKICRCKHTRVYWVRVANLV